MKKRTTYFILFCGILLAEIIIALFIRDNFIRPYFGDILVTVLICCFCRIFIPNGAPALPIFVFIFALLVEVAQFLNIVKLLGLENNAFFSTVIGTSFSFIDIICYAVGCILFYLIDKKI